MVDSAIFLDVELTRKLEIAMKNYFPQAFPDFSPSCQLAWL